MLIRTPADIGASVREARRLRNMTQERLAKETDVSVRWLISFERGKGSAEIGMALRVMSFLKFELDLRDPLAVHSEGDLFEHRLDDDFPDVDEIVDLKPRDPATKETTS
jgi:transcriptional regulator with XRE-family HTH domain